MLPKLKRLNLKKDFKWVALGKRVNFKYATLFFRIGENSFPRIGIAVSSKIFKNPTQRNRARRLVSSCFESLYGRLPTNINIVALPKAKVIEVKSGDLLLELEQTLKNEKIIN